MLEVNNFNAIRISLASPDQIREWSKGEDLVIRHDIGDACKRLSLGRPVRI